MGNSQMIWEWIGNHLWTVIIALSVFIQISPIKINPWSTILKWVGKAIVGETCGKIDTIIKNLGALDKEVKENEKDRIRWEILAFANSCHSGIKHSRDEFNHIMELNDKYTTLLEKTNEKNGVFKAEYKYIRDLYDELNKTDAFIKIGDEDNE